MRTVDVSRGTPINSIKDRKANNSPQRSLSREENQKEIKIKKQGFLKMEVVLFQFRSTVTQQRESRADKLY